MIPLRLFADRNIALTSVAGLAVGAGMFAGIFYVPLFMQAVVGTSSASSGMALVPLMFGLILTSTVSGIAISRIGRYKEIMIAGPIVAALGLWLLSRMTVDTSVFDAGWRMAIVGAGIGIVMQNLVLVAQNSVSTRDTGVVTSLSTLMRSVGGTVGISILGTIFATHLANNIRDEMAKLGPKAAAGGGGAKLDQDTILHVGDAGLPGPIEHAIRAGVSDSLTHVFLIAVPFMAIALLACLALRRDELSRESAIKVVDELEHELADLVPVDAAHAPESYPPAAAEPEVTPGR
jgi:hypothetical protein